MTLKELEAQVEMLEETGKKIEFYTEVNPQRLLGPAQHVVVDEYGNVGRMRLGVDAHLGAMEV